MVVVLCGDWGHVWFGVWRLVECHQSALTISSELLSDERLWQDLLSNERQQHEALLIGSALSLAGDPLIALAVNIMQLFFVFVFLLLFLHTCPLCFAAGSGL